MLFQYGRLGACVPSEGSMDTSMGFVGRTTAVSINIRPFLVRAYNKIVFRLFSDHTPSSSGAQMTRHEPAYGGGGIAWIYVARNEGTHSLQRVGERIMRYPK
jgi:hypothetical protein